MTPPAIVPEDQLALFSRAGLKSRLAAIGCHPNSTLGQHFLIDLGTVEFILEQAAIEPDDHILEIGPGLGQLTFAIAGSGATLTAIEMDRAYFQYLEKQLGRCPNVTLRHADAIKLLKRFDHLKEPLRMPFRIVSNLPYQITSPLLAQALIMGDRIPEMLLTIQYEVAERLIGAPGDSRRGPLAVLLEVQHQVELLRVLDHRLFWPAPEVRSAIIRIRRRPEPRTRVEDFAGFSHMVRHCFLKRRKKMRNALVGKTPFPDSGGAADALLEQAGIDPSSRPEQLDVTAFGVLWRVLGATAGEVR